MASDTDIPGLDQPLSYEPEPSKLLPNLLLRRVFITEPSTNQLPLTTLREQGGTGIEKKDLGSIFFSSGLWVD